MAWLRLDDGFTKHPKFEGWTPAHRWAWLEVMEYCAKYRTRGRIPTDLSLLPRSVTASLLAKAEAADWCSKRFPPGSGEPPDQALWINDWDEYNPPEVVPDELEARVKEAVESHPDASANELFQMIGGRRKQVLELIRRFRTGTDPGSQSGSRNHPGTGSRAGVPSRPVKELPKAVPAPSYDTTPEDAGPPDHDNDHEAEEPRPWIASNLEHLTPNLRGIK